MSDDFLSLEEIFWRNVEYFMNAYEISWTEMHKDLKTSSLKGMARARKGLNFSTAKKIAGALDIEDVTILFEGWEDERHEK